jgi:predicted dehydrogenase
VRFDWRQALEEIRPDIVALATTAAAHCEMAVAAAQLGCHILCDKPLGINAAEGRRMLLVVEQAGVRHAYAASSRYAPAAIHARALIAGGLIGQVHFIESTNQGYISPRIIHTWFHELSQGGGLLNTVFTHKLSQVLFITGGSVRAAAGEAGPIIDRAPVGPVLHDFRAVFAPSAVLSHEEADSVEWRPADSEWGYTIRLQLQLPGGQLANALFMASLKAPNPQPSYLALHGTQGSLHLVGFHEPEQIQHFDVERQSWDDIPVPQSVLDSLPQEADATQRDWNQLVREFVADIRGEGYAGYPTFHDGWLANEIIDVARNGLTWATITAHP